MGSGKSVDFGAVLTIARVGGTSEAPVGKNHKVVGTVVTAAGGTGWTASADPSVRKVFAILQLFDFQFHLQKAPFL